MAKSDNLRKARATKNDEFYTRLEDIETEISMHQDYVRHFQGKTVLCNCDDPEYSNFFVFFRLHFKQLGLKKLITTHYNKNGNPSYKIEWEGETLHDDTVNMITTPLEGNGDFRSDECIELLKEADIVVTNPPFSLFREYIAQLMEYDKEFVIIGNKNAITYREFFPLLQENKVWIGYTIPNNFILPDGTITKQQNGLTRWFTNLDIDKRHDIKPLTKNYKGHKENCPKYDNYNAINIDKVDDIPKDYKGIMGVPITFLDKYNPEQFEIIGLDRYTIPKQFLVDGRAAINGKPKYARILIQRKEVPADES